HVHAPDLIRGHGRGRLRDRAAVTREANVLDPAIAVDRQLHLQLVATERIQVLVLEVGMLDRGARRAPVVRVLVVVEDVLAIQVVHLGSRLAGRSWVISAPRQSGVVWGALRTGGVAAAPRTGGARAALRTGGARRSEPP